MRRTPMSRLLGQSWARLSYGRFVEPFWLETNEIDIRIPDLDPRLNGLRILQMTDFHLCRRVPASHIRRAVEKGRQLQCDIVALTGDFVHAGFHYVSQIASIMGRVNAPLGVYAVLGNHDYSVRVYRGRRKYPRLAEEMGKALQDQGVTLLANQHQIVDYHGAKLAVAGTCDLWSGDADLPLALKGIDENVPRVVLAHNPWTIDQSQHRRCDLMLSGHTHGGQIELSELGGSLFSRFKHRLAAGLYYHDTGYLYVNKGIGYTVRFRYQVRPELAVFRLVRWDQSDNLDAL